LGKQYNNASEFSRVFKLGKLFDDEKLTDNSPCNKCRVAKECSEIANSDYVSHYGSNIDRENELANICRKCIEKINYDMRCVAKLSEYENICISTESLRERSLNDSNRK
jgi:hypothetical protein